MYFRFLYIFQLKILKWKYSRNFVFPGDLPNSKKNTKRSFFNNDLMWFQFNKSYFKRLKFSNIRYINSPQKRRHHQTTEMSSVNAIFSSLGVMSERRSDWLGNWRYPITKLVRIRNLLRPYMVINYDHARQMKTSLPRRGGSGSFLNTSLVFLLRMSSASFSSFLLDH